MTDILELEDLPSEDFEEKQFNMSSINHSLTQARLTGLLISDERYTVAIELSLDVSFPERQEILKRCNISSDRKSPPETLIPDICLFHAGEIDYLEPDEEDVLKTEKVPLLCVEIVSSSQSSTQILRKFGVYFAMGVKSCWYVDPKLKLINVYSENLRSVETFTKTDEVIDHHLNIRFPLTKVLSKQVPKTLSD
jgi:Uma2 family endonuclease